MKWEILDRQEAYRGFFRLERLQLRHSLARGGLSPILTRELIANKDAVAVLPYDPVRRTVVLVEQFRTGAIYHPKGPWLAEIVAGFIECDELPDDVARRELLEETGCHALSLRLLMEYFPSPGALQERVFLYFATIDSSQAAAIGGREDEGEDIRTRILPLEEALKLTHHGVAITSANTIIAMQYLEKMILRDECP